MQYMSIRAYRGTVVSDSRLGWEKIQTARSSSAVGSHNADHLLRLVGRNDSGEIAMYLTEEEAKKEDCPFKNKWCDLCCMAWRWAGWVNAANHTDGREPRPQPMEKDLILAANVESEIVRVGYCGACGGPE